MADKNNPTVKEEVATPQGVTPPQPTPKEPVPTGEAKQKASTDAFVKEEVAAPNGTTSQGITPSQPTSKEPAPTGEAKQKASTDAFVKESIIMATFLANPLIDYLYFNMTGQAFFTEGAAEESAPADNPRVVRIDNPQKPS